MKTIKMEVIAVQKSQIFCIYININKFYEGLPLGTSRKFDVTELVLVWIHEQKVPQNSIDLQYHNIPKHEPHVEM